MLAYNTKLELIDLWLQPDKTTSPPELISMIYAICKTNKWASVVHTPLQRSRNVGHAKSAAMST